jgi:hypothetical protein
MKQRAQAVIVAVAIAIASLLSLSAPAQAALILSNTHTYAFGADVNAVEVLVEVFDDFLGDSSKYLWQYTVTNNSYDPNPGTSNGFSGFETALPIAVADLGDVFAPNADWEIDCCSGQPVEWDIRNSDGLGVMPGETGVFGFTSLPRLITNSTGWFHTWQGDAQTDLVFYPAGDGPEVPDVLQPPLQVPGPGSLFLIVLGATTLAVFLKR